MEDDYAPALRRVASLEDLARQLDRLRRAAAGGGQMMISGRQIAKKIHRAPSAIAPYLSGERLGPADVYEQILRALGVKDSELRPWLDAWDRVADATGPRRRRTTARERDLAEGSRPLSHFTQALFRLVSPSPNPDARLGFVTGGIRGVRCADIWVNPENTEMRMPRVEEYSVSAIIRYEGAVRDEAGRILDDRIADELERRVSGIRPVVPGTAIATGAGELTGTHGVRHIIHVAAVQGEPGRGYRQVLDIARCVKNVLAVAEGLVREDAVPHTVLFPILGAGVGGAAPGPTIEALVGAAVEYLTGQPRPRVGAVLLLAYSAAELAACQATFAADPRLVAA